jgi:hypothetical protein
MNSMNCEIGGTHVGDQWHKVGHLPIRHLYECYKQNLNYVKYCMKIITKHNEYHNHKP